MQDLKITLIMLIILISAPLTGAERPPQPPQSQEKQDQEVRARLSTLPKELQREVLNIYFYAAYPNLAKIAERIIAFKDKITAPTLINFFQELPYFANVVDLATKLQRLQVMQNEQIKNLVNSAQKSLSHGDELLMAVAGTNLTRLDNILKNKNVALNFGWSYNGSTALMQATGSEAMVRRLLAAGADVNAQTVCGSSALSFAAGGRKNIKIIDLLLDAGANIDAQNDQGNTALMTASKGGFTEIVEHLLAAGANIDVRSKYTRQTARDYAQEARHPEIAKLLDDAIAARKAKMEKK